MAVRQAAGDGVCSRAAGGAFALFSLLKRQGALGKGDGSAAQDRLLHQYSTGPVRTGAAAASPRSLRRRASGGRSQPGPEQGATGRPAAAAPGGAGRAAHDWRQRLISVRRCALAGRAKGAWKRDIKASVLGTSVRRWWPVLVHYQHFYALVA